MKAEGNGNGYWSRAVLEPWPEPVPGEELLDKLARELSRFVVLPKWGAAALALWILHTYAFHFRNIAGGWDGAWVRNYRFNLAKDLLAEGLSSTAVPSKSQAAKLPEWFSRVSRTSGR